MIHSLLHTFSEPRICSSIGGEIARMIGRRGPRQRRRRRRLRRRASRTTAGRPSCKKLHRQIGHLLVAVSQLQPAGRHELADDRRLDPFGLRTASTTRAIARGGTARTIRSWASEIQISVYDSPSYFSGTRSSQTSRADLLAHFADGAGKAARRRNR